MFALNRVLLLVEVQIARRLGLLINTLQCIYYEFLRFAMIHDGSRGLGERRVPPERRFLVQIEAVHEHVSVEILHLKLRYLAQFTTLL